MCGIVGIFSHAHAARLTRTGLFALQHRGQESAGIVASDGDTLTRTAGTGLVSEAIPPDVAGLVGDAAIGHVRYSTSGGTGYGNAQPLLMQHHRGPLAIAHNGNLVDAPLTRSELEESGAIFRTTSDTEVICHLVARSRAADVVDALVESLHQVRGAFSLVVLVPGRLVVVRDPYGFRPISLGRLDGSWVVASESCALEMMGARFEREVRPGEVVVIDVAGLHSFEPFPKTGPAPCAFEYVYFSRPDSAVFGRSVRSVRRRLGQELFAESPAPGADAVVPVPDSGVYAALGYAEASKIPFEMGLVRNHYVGRTFIRPDPQDRASAVRLKLNPIRDVFEGRKIVLVDDSIVRGTTSRRIVALCRDAGAREIHVRVSCPPTIGPCRYGIDTPTREELIAASQSIERIREFIGADSLAYLGLEGLARAIGEAGTETCTACWTDDQPVKLPKAEARQIGLFGPQRAAVRPLGSPGTLRLENASGVGRGTGERNERG